MMIYCEQRSDTDILNDLDEEKRVIVLGCPVCANMSLYIQKAAEDTPMLTISPTGFTAVSMLKEVDRLKQLLNEKGLEVDTWIGKYPIVALCVPDKKNCKKIIEKCQNFKTVITLCCDAGRKSVESLLPEKKIIAGMNAKGLVNGRLKSKMVYAKMYFDKKSVNITRFSFDV